MARRVYVRAADHPWAPFQNLYHDALEGPQWQAHRVAGGHDRMVDTPDDVARILRSLVETSS